MSMTDTPSRPDTPLGGPGRTPRPASADVLHRMATGRRHGLPVHPTAGRAVARAGV